MVRASVVLFGGGCLASCTSLTPSQPNRAVPFFGVDGEFSSDDPAPRTPSGEAACTADYAPGGRNPGLIRLVRNETFSFYADRDGRRALAEGCTYRYLGFRADPRYFGTAAGKSTTSIWMTYELTSTELACEGRFHFVAIRAPEGEGVRRHLHLRFGPRMSSVDALVELSTARPLAGDPCEPWWSVYCSRGNKGCDPD